MTMPGLSLTRQLPTEPSDGRDWIELQIPPGRGPQQVRIYIDEINGSADNRKVRIRITAPPTVGIFRGELLMRGLRG